MATLSTVTCFAKYNLQNGSPFVFLKPILKNLFKALKVPDHFDWVKTTIMVPSYYIQRRLLYIN